MKKFFNNVILSYIKKWNKNEYKNILEILFDLKKNHEELQHKISIVSNNVDFANAHLVKMSQYFINSLPEERILSLPHNKQFVFFSYPQAIFHALEGENIINLGDYVQTIATRNAVLHNYSDISYEYWDRDNLLNYVSNDGFSKICIMQGFFPISEFCFPNKYLFPIFIGFHLGGCMEYASQANGSENLWKYFIQRFPHYLKDKSIGCRDKRTMLFLRSLGLNAYFSRCLTLTLPKRDNKPIKEKVFISCFPHIYKTLDKVLPLDIKANSVLFSPEFDINQIREFSFQTIENVDILPYTQEYLDRLKEEATLVITDRIHIASPCIAMGIPTIVIKRSDNDPRYDIFDGIIKCYSIDELIHGKVDFAPNEIDIEELKIYMLENVKLTIEEEAYKATNTEKLANLRKKIETFSLFR